MPATQTPDLANYNTDLVAFRAGQDAVNEVFGAYYRELGRRIGFMRAYAWTIETALHLQERDSEITTMNGIPLGIARA